MGIDWRIVYRSRRVWDGCWPAPSPALITGTVANSAASRAAPSFGCRMTIASAYPLTTRIVSARVSPFAMEQASTLPTETEVPPRRAMADSKDIRVRVLGSKKSTARILPFRAFLSYFLLSICRAWSSMRSIASRSKSPMDMICCKPPHLTGFL